MPGPNVSLSLPKLIKTRHNGDTPRCAGSRAPRGRPLFFGIASLLACRVSHQRGWEHNANIRCAGHGGLHPPGRRGTLRAVAPKTMTAIESTHRLRGTGLGAITGRLAGVDGVQGSSIREGMVWSRERRNNELFMHMRRVPACGDLPGHYSSVGQEVLWRGW